MFLLYILESPFCAYLVCPPVLYWLKYWVECAKRWNSPDATYLAISFTRSLPWHNDLLLNHEVGWLCHPALQPLHQVAEHKLYHQKLYLGPTLLGSHCYAANHHMTIQRGDDSCLAGPEDGRYVVLKLTGSLLIPQPNGPCGHAGSMENGWHLHHSCNPVKGIFYAQTCGNCWQVLPTRIFVRDNTTLRKKFKMCIVFHLPLRQAN